MAESRKPTFAWDSHNKRWGFWVGDKTQPIVTIDGNGLTVNKGSLSYNALTVGSLIAGDTLNIGAQGSIQDVNVGTLATLQAINTGGQGSIANLNTTTGTITTLNAVNVAKLTRVQVGGGGTISYMAKFTGTIPLTNVPTAGAAVATMTGVGSSGIAVGDLLSYNLKAASIAGIGIVSCIVPTTNVVVFKVLNPAIDTAGSQPPVGVDVMVTRTTVS